MHGNQADLHHDIDAVVAFDTQLIASDITTVGNIIDMKGKLAIDFAILSGVLTDGDYTVILEEGDDSGLSDAANIPAARLLGGQGPAGVALPKFELTDDDTIFRVGFFKLKRFVRLSLLSDNTTTGGTLGAIAVVNPDLTLTT